VTVRVIAGAFRGAHGPVQAQATQPLYLDVRLQGRSQVNVPVPPGHNAFAYVYDGVAHVGGRTLEARHLGVLSHGDEVTLTAAEAGARLILVAGRPLGEPVARYGPFVMNTVEEVHQAVRDYSAGRL
jgi:redox-sensitive bicupin YhaK (pirin superfamily)